MKQSFSKKKRPNILVFMTDQQLSDTLLPNHKAITPNVDRFRERSIQFTQSYCPAPHCCPSRATFFTGLYPSEHGVWHNVEIPNAISRGVYDGVRTFPELLKENGYYNIFSGKWHVSAYEGPQDRGFDTVLHEQISNYGRMTRDNVPHYEDWENFYSDASTIDGCNETKEFGRIMRPGYPRYFQFGIDENPFNDNNTVSLAVKAIENYDEDAPFFMYVGTTGPHDPYTPPQEFLDMYDINDINLPDSFDDSMDDKPALYRRTREQFRLTREEHKESLRRYLAFCSYEDNLFGKLLDCLDRKQLWENTVVIYLSDHGDYAGAHGLWAKGLPCFREAYNICSLVGGAGITARGLNDNFVSLADFAPTILDLAGVKHNLSLTGKSLVPLLCGQDAGDDWRTEIYTQSNGNEVYGIQRAVWNKKWKYVYNSFDYDELYDLENDPQEIYNVAGKQENAPIIEEMCRKLWSFARDRKDNCTCGYIMVGLAPYGPGITLK